MDEKKDVLRGAETPSDKPSFFSRVDAVAALQGAVIGLFCAFALGFAWGILRRHVVF